MKPTRAPLVALLALAPFAACGGEPGSTLEEPPQAYRAALQDAEDAADGVPPTARMDTVRGLREGRDAVRHASDGGGRAWLEETGGEPPAARVQTAGTWTIVYEAGPLGVAAGGSILLQVSPFWGWSDPQTSRDSAPGYTEVSTEAEGVLLDARALDRNLLGIRVDGRDLQEGERVRIVYGAGRLGARADKYAERGSRFWIRVDGDGDGVSGILADSPSVDVAPGPPTRLLLTLPTVARPGETVRLTLAVLDDMGDSGVDVAGRVRLDGPPGLKLAPSVELVRADRGCTTVEAVVRGSGVMRVAASLELGGEALTAESNPLVVTEAGPRVFWGDLHGHSNLSDGTGVAEDYFTYARDVAGLDVVSLTDHDHWGMLPLDEHPDVWEEIQLQARAFHEPGRFVTLLGFEWTNWIYGHRHVLYFGDEGRVISSLDEETDHPHELWDALRGTDALTIAHHSAGGPIAIDWTIAPDPELEPVTEVVSAHGSSEADDSPLMIYSPVRGNHVRDALDRGYRFGFVGSGDGHDGHPGLTEISPEYPTGGLAAILADELTRESVLEALRKRRVYATSGPRIFLRCALDGHRMGSDVPAAELGEQAELFLHAVGSAPIGRVDLVRSGGLVDSFPGEGRRELALTATLVGLAPGEYVYARVVQVDATGGSVRGLAWTSPFYVR